MATYAIGDLQCSFSHFLAVLEARGLLTRDRRLHADVKLVTVGDYFDYHDKVNDSVADTCKNGFEILNWLASHDSTQVTILLGNHDIARVQELISMSDERFKSARDMAFALDSPGSSISVNDFFAEYPEIPNPLIVQRDFSSYGELQRNLLIQLLLDKRVQLATAAEWCGRPILLNHAGVTNRELSILGVPELRDPVEIARLLNKALEDGVDRVREAWRVGDLRPLDLAPLHVSGIASHEGGGLLYHRPSNPDFYTDSWAYDKLRPRRYLPKSLPKGIIQGVGHTNHKKCRKELGDWVEGAAKERDCFDLRTLIVTEDDRVSYRRGLQEGLPEGGAVLVMLDGAMNDCVPGDYPLLHLDETEH
ncbi:MAG: metallophosphoesterase [Planctomycetota bacterium]|nr:metallophosphoesterase [Planctomycetota bacterium]